MRKTVILFAILAAILVGNMVVAHLPCRDKKGCHPVTPFMVNVVNVYKEAENKCSDCGENGGTYPPTPTVTGTGPGSVVFPPIPPIPPQVPPIPPQIPPYPSLPWISPPETSPTYSSPPETSPTTTSTTYSSPPETSPPDTSPSYTDPTTPSIPSYEY